MALECNARILYLTLKPHLALFLLKHCDVLHILSSYIREMGRSVLRGANLALRLEWAVCIHILDVSRENGERSAPLL